MKWITPNQNDGHSIFVFGSNLAGRHGAGAAKDAARFWGAERGVGNGRTGQSYAIPTKDARLHALPLVQIRKFVSQFKGYAKQQPKLRFLVTEVGCGLAGYTVYDVAPLFEKCPPNCELPDTFLHELTKQVENIGNTLVAAALRVGILVPKPAEVARYVAKFPRFQKKLLKQLPRLQKDFSDLGQLSLEMFYDPEGDDEFLTLKVRRYSYFTSFMKCLRTRAAPHLDLFNCPGDLSITTDFQQPINCDV